jgi:predicted amidohydrolase
MGDTLELNSKPEIRINVSSSDQKAHNVDVRIIRSGKLIRTISKTTPFAVDFKEDYFNPGELIYYRLEISGKLVSNPIFVKFGRE